MVTLTVNETATCLQTAQPTACQILWDLLDRWVALDETQVSCEQVEDLYCDIVG
jgi:hypothetical protein